MSIGEHARQWAQWSQAEAARIVETAAGSSLGGSAAWDAVLRDGGVDPLSAEDRQRHIRVGPPRRLGPSPIEVRWALHALARKVADAAEQLQASCDASDADDAVERQVELLRRSADQLVETFLPRYISAVRPKITTSSIFANARASSRSRVAPVEAGAATLACACCGAPRRGDARDRTCEFCGSAV